MEYLKLFSNTVLPMIMSIGGGMFAMHALHYLLNGMKESIMGMIGIISALELRVRSMTNELFKIDLLVMNRLGLQPDLERVARTQSKDDLRRD
jgi:hypothetical protein